MSSAILIGALLSAAAGSTPAPAPALLAAAEASRAELTWTWRQIQRQEAGFTLVNKGSSSLTVKPDLLGFAEGRSDLKLQVLPQTNQTIGPWRSYWFAVQATGARPAPGVYPGLVRFLDPTGKILLVVQVTVSVPGPDMLQGKLVETRWRWSPFGGGLVHPWLPVPDDAADILNNRGAPFAYLRSDTGGWAKLEWAKVDHGKYRAAFCIDRPLAAGKYDAEVALSDAPAKAPLAISVIVQDLVMWPAAVILIGSYAAYRAKRYVGVLRVTHTLRLEEAEVGVAFEEASARFQASAGGRPWARSLLADFEERRKRVRQQIEAIERSPATAIDASSKAYQDAVSGLADLETAVDRWPALGDALAALSGAAAGIGPRFDGADLRPREDGRDAPDFAPAVRQELQAAAVKVADLAARIEQATQDRMLCVRWAAARSVLVELTRQAAALPDQAAIRTQVVGVWEGLYSVQDAVSLGGVTAPGGAIEQFRLAIERLAGQGGAVGLMASDAVSRAVTAALGSFVERPRRAVPDRRRARELRQGIGRSDNLVAWYGAALGLLTGLSVLYLGKPFGSLADYVAVLLWAAGAKVGLDLMLSVVDRLGALGQRR
jgi:hypothetical protein